MGGRVCVGNLAVLWRRGQGRGSRDSHRLLPPPLSLGGAARRRSQAGIPQPNPLPLPHRAPPGPAGTAVNFCPGSPLSPPPPRAARDGGGKEPPGPLSLPGAAGLWLLLRHRLGCNGRSAGARTLPARLCAPEEMHAPRPASQGAALLQKNKLKKKKIIKKINKNGPSGLAALWPGLAPRCRRSRAARSRVNAARSGAQPGRAPHPGRAGGGASRAFCRCRWCRRSAV